MVVVALVAVAAVVVWLGSAPSHARTAQSEGATGALPDGSPASLHVAGALAVGSTGALYVADVARHRVLVRLTDGRYRVVAGNGHSGYSGDGGSALRAELSTVSGLAFAPKGSLYPVDGGRVRMVTPVGIIRTIAGDGRPARRIAAGTPARAAPLGTARENDGASIAIAPDGELDIATSIQLLRLTADGTLEPVRDVAAMGAVHGGLDTGLGHIAVDDHGDIDVSGVNGWSVWQLTTN